MPKLSFPVDSYALQSLPADAQRLLNIYAEKLPPNSPWPVILRSTPGLKLAYTYGTGPILALDGSLSGRLYAVSGDQFIRVVPDDEGPPEVLGIVGISANGDFPTIAVGTTSVCVCVPPNAWVADHSGPLSQITDPGYTDTGASSVAYVDGYYVFTDFSNSSRFFNSNLLSGTTFDGLQFAYADLRPNVVRRVIFHRGDLVFLGEDGLEFWYNQGGKNFPFARRAGADVGYGCGAAQSVQQLDNAVFYLSYNYTVFRVDAYQATRVSTYAIEEMLRYYGDFTQIDSCAYESQGHAYYVLSLTGATKRTFVYDCAMSAWHERASGLGGIGTWLGRAAAQRGQVTIIGDRASGNVYTLEPGTFDDNGVTLTRIATLPPIYADTDRAFMHRLTLEAQVGIMPSDNRVQLDVSDDGGNTYRERPDGVTAGALGDTRHRIAWTRLGSFRERTLRFTLNGPCALYGAEAEVDKGTS